MIRNLGLDEGKGVVTPGTKPTDVDDKAPKLVLLRAEHLSKALRRSVTNGGFDCFSQYG
jgi:hypothetical protein